MHVSNFFRFREFVCGGVRLRYLANAVGDLTPLKMGFLFTRFFVVYSDLKVSET